MDNTFVMKETCKKLAEEIISGLDEMELSYFRREFIARSYLFDGDESFTDAGKEIENGYSSEYDLMNCLYCADKKFMSSKEYLAYARRKQEKEKKDLIAQLEAMSEEELHALRRQRLEYELNGTQPIPYEDENGHIDLDKYDQSEAIKALWKYDKGWDDSEEGKEVGLRKREKWSGRSRSRMGRTSRQISRNIQKPRFRRDRSFNREYY